ncbi:solute carrier family 35 member G1 [Seminavis robusta]|uniref:Solute carrier family 35 member G1 n=1 Tax=Seminavis robusta TaxID=568900 RepID=A0A9N8EXL8_9STRA|nr:solute carrier family 35 member G1 [Seminavis robusta]|eukprot:Sro2363_g324940.1 solute carrier family 35 member G1 (362) ;mRNA; r:10221-11426
MTTKTTPHAHKPKHSLKGMFLIFLGSFSFSVMFLMVKLMADVNTFTLVFYRSWIQIIISIISLYRKGVSPFGPADLKVQLLLVSRAVFGALAVCAWFFGIQLLPLPDAVTLQFTTPPFAAAFAVCMVGERWKLLDIIGAVVCLSGVAFIAHPTWLFGGGEDVEDTVASETDPFMKALAVLVTTGGAAMAGIAYVCVRKIGNRADAIVMVLYYGVLSIPMCFLGSGFFLGEWNVWGNFQQFTVKDYFLLVLMGFGGYGGQFFTNLGLQNETAATATLATSTQIVWTYVFELAFLHDHLDTWSLFGTGLIMGYMLCVAFIKTLATDKLAEASPEEQKGLLDMDDEKPEYQSTTPLTQASVEEP